jgi:hypothetical protein
MGHVFSGSPHASVFSDREVAAHFVSRVIKDCATIFFTRVATTYDVNALAEGSSARPARWPRFICNNI